MAALLCSILDATFVFGLAICVVLAYRNHGHSEHIPEICKNLRLILVRGSLEPSKSSKHCIGLQARIL